MSRRETPMFHVKHREPVVPETIAELDTLPVGTILPMTPSTTDRTAFVPKTTAPTKAETPSRALAYRLGQIKTDLEDAVEATEDKIENCAWRSAILFNSRAVELAEEAQELFSQQTAKPTATVAARRDKITELTKRVYLNAGRLSVFLGLYEATGTERDVPPYGWAPILARGAARFDPASIYSPAAPESSPTEDAD